MANQLACAELPAMPRHGRAAAMPQCLQCTTHAVLASRQAFWSPRPSSKRRVRKLACDASEAKHYETVPRNSVLSAARPANTPAVNLLGALIGSARRSGESAAHGSSAGDLAGRRTRLGLVKAAAGRAPYPISDE